MTASPVILIVTFLALGCSHNSNTAELAKVYHVGLTRLEAADLLGRPQQVAVRPPAGWPANDTTTERTSALVIAFEEKNKVSVQTCEVYRVSRGLMGLGIYW